MILKFNKRIKCHTLYEKSLTAKPLWQESNRIMGIFNCSTNIRDISKSKVANIKLESYFIESLYSLTRNNIMCMVSDFYFRFRGKRIS